MSTLPMNGGIINYETEAAKLRRQRAIVDRLRQQFAQPQPLRVFEGGSTPMFGQSVGRVASNGMANGLLNVLGGALASYGDSRLDKQEAANDKRASEQAAEALRNFPQLQAEKVTPAITLPAGQQGPTRPETTETYRRSPAEYQSALTQWAGGLDPSNPHLKEYQGKVLEKSMGLAGDIARQDAAAKIKVAAGTRAQQDPNSLKEYLAGHPNANMSDPEVANDYMTWVNTTYRGTSAVKNANTILGGGELAKQIVNDRTFAQNPSRNAALESARTRIMANAPAYSQQYGDQAGAMMQRDINDAVQEIDSRFAPQQVPNQAGQRTPMEVQGSGPDYENPSPNPSGPELKTPLKMSSDMELSPLEIAEIQSAANQGDPSAIAAAKQWNIPVGGTARPLAKSITAAQAPTSGTTGLPRATGRSAPPVYDPVKGKADETVAVDTAEAKVKATVALPKLRDGLAQSKKVLADIQAMPAAKRTGSIRSAVTGKLTEYTNIATEAGDLNVAVAQARAKAMGPAYEALRGTGSVATAEGNAAIEAYNRMSTSTSPAEFIKAQEDFISNYEAVIRQQEQIAGAPHEPDTPVLPPEAPKRKKYNPATKRIE